MDGGVLPGERRASAYGFVRPSLRRALADVITLHWLRTVMALATAVVAAVIAYIATGSPGAWYAAAAAPVVLLGAYFVLFLVNLGGWNRRWRAGCAPDPPRGRLTLHLQPKDQTVRYWAPDVDCWVRSPSGITAKWLLSSDTIQRDYYAIYPDDFEPAEPLAPGRYRVTWVEEAGSGKWREILTHRVTVTDAMVLQPPPPVTPD